MSLSCSCGDWDPDPGDHVWYQPDRYCELETSQRKRCCSCTDLIDLGSTVAKVYHYRIPETDVEIRIYGEDGEIPLAIKYLCEECADIFFSLEELGYCNSPLEDQFELLDEYHDLVKSELQPL